MRFVATYLIVLATDTSWWIMLKSPNEVQKHPGDTTYDYADNNTHTFHPSDHPLNAVSSPLAVVMKRYLEAQSLDNAGYVEWNDQHQRRRHKRNRDCPPAHAKGLLFFNADGGTLLTHSVPKFPVRGNVNWYPQTGHKNGQHFLCVNLTRDEVNKFAQEVLLVMYPKITDKRLVSPALAKNYPMLDMIINAQRKDWNTRSGIHEVNLTLSDGTMLTVITKPCRQHISIYDHTAVAYGPLLAQTWLGGGHANAIPSNARVRKVCVLRNALEKDWETKVDHSKLVVGKSPLQGVLGVGDLNRQSTQHYRGGSLYLLESMELRRSLRLRTVEFDETCEEKKHKCSDPWIRDPEKDDVICISGQCKCRDEDCCKAPDLNPVGAAFPSSLTCLAALTICASNIKRPHTRRLSVAGICVTTTASGLQCVPNGTEGTWSDWTFTGCSKPCGGGMQSRSRTCSLLDGCPGLASDTFGCNNENCESCCAKNFAGYFHPKWCTEHPSTVVPLVSQASAGCGGCPPSTEEVYTCLDESTCSEQECCNAHGGIARCPSNFPFMCRWKVCGVEHCCVADSAECDEQGGVLRTCPSCHNNSSSLEMTPGWEGYTCARTQYCKSYPDIMLRYCPRACGACRCADNDAGLQTEPGLGCHTCASMADSCATGNVKLHCRRSCLACDNKSLDKWETKRSAVEKCPAIGTNCAKMSGPQAPCAVAVPIGAMGWLGRWDDQGDTVWVADTCTLRVYEHAEFEGKSQKYLPGTHALGDWSMIISSVKCDCQCVRPSFPDGVVLAEEKVLSREDFHVLLRCVHGYTLVGAPPLAKVCDAAGLPYKILHAESCVANDAVGTWIRFPEQYTDRECANIGDAIHPYEENCRNNCLRTPYCNAVNFGEVARECVFRMCGANVIRPMAGYPSSGYFSSRFLQACGTNAEDGKAAKPCVFPFTYDGQLFTTCTQYSNDDPWCSTQVDSNGVTINGQWGICSNICGAECRTDDKRCIFPFSYDGVTFTECTMYGHTRRWCSTQVDENGITVESQWGECTNLCPPACTTEEGTPCVFPFIFRGVAYMSCTEVDSDFGERWCSTEVDGKGIHVPHSWGVCSKFCTSGCTTHMGDTCKFPFIYKGRSHHACTLADNDYWWCSTRVDIDHVHVPGNWGACSKQCPPACTAGMGERCVFPFTYKDRHFTACTTFDNDDAWCATELDEDGQHTKWGVCSKACPAECSTEKGRCVFPFVYGDVRYTSCTTIDNGQRWCSVEVDENGHHVPEKWGYCDYFCD